MSKKISNKNDFDSFQDFDNKFSNSPNRSKNQIDDRTREIYKHNEKILDNLEILIEHKEKHLLSDKSVESGSNNHVPLIDIFSVPTTNNVTRPNVFTLDSINFENTTTYSANDIKPNTFSNNLNNVFGAPSNNVGFNSANTNSNTYTNTNTYTNNMNMGSVNMNPQQSNYNLNQNLMGAYNNTNYIQGNNNMSNQNTTTYSGGNNQVITPSPYLQQQILHTEIEAKKDEPMNDFKVRYI
jgi:hypothetical protein